jgi:hypothetical protein
LPVAVLALPVLILVFAAPLSAVENVTIRREGAEKSIAGKILVEAEDGGLLLLAPDGVLWAVQPDELGERKADEAPFEPLDAKSMGQSLLEELPEGFKIHTTAHYVIGYNTSLDYAKWCGGLYERLYSGFRNYWSTRGLELHDPDFPLVAVVFGDKSSYAKYAAPELGSATDSIIGYYSLRSNRVVMYDLTGVDGVTGGRARGTSAARINQILAQPEAERTVATIVHEATHQIAFNCGVHQRYADIPLWVSEGIAVYFETPDLKASRGWRTIGGVNQVRLERFRRYQRSRPENSLLSLLAEDKRFRDGALAEDAYAETWALNYFLMRRKPELYVQYLQALSQKEPLIYDTPQERVEQFQAVFGSELEELDAEFLRFLRNVR